MSIFRHNPRLHSCFLLLGLLWCNPAFSEEKPIDRYEVVFSAKFLPQRGIARASIRVTQSSHLLRLLDLSAPLSEYSDFSGDGDITREGDRLLWKVPDKGGTLIYDFQVNHLRDSLLDAQMTEDWAIVRLDHVFPPARVRSRRGANSDSTLILEGPVGWRFESRYRVRQGLINIEKAGQRFDRPTGWLAAGKLGVRRETIAERKVTVAAPVDQGMRRLDIIAYLRWTLPKLVRLFPGFPDRLLIVGAADGMWRGGLSGPGSVYMHSGLPLISENATSTLIHELVHTAMSSNNGKREDWIIEGVAEYYSLEILRRSGGISTKRFDKAMGDLASWANRENGQLLSPSSAANTARAVMIFDMIQRELTLREAGNLDSIVRKLFESDVIDSNRLLSLVEAKLDAPFESLRLALQNHPPPLD